MSNRNLPSEANEILSSPQAYYARQQETLEEMLENVSIDEDAIVNTASKKLIRDKLMGYFKITDVINTLINWNEAVDEDIKRAKKEHLLHEVILGLQQQGSNIDSLKRFISDPMGNTLYNKIIRILENYPPDEQLSQHLAKAIEHILDTDFVGMFEAHKYAISQIEQLTPQALTILADSRSWPVFNLNTYSATGTRITTDWLPTFTQAYCNIKRVTDPLIVERIRHSIGFLKTQEYIVAELQEDKTVRCFITQVGSHILPYIGS